MTEATTSERIAMYRGILLKLGATIAGFRPDVVAIWAKKSTKGGTGGA